MHWCNSTQLSSLLSTFFKKNIQNCYPELSPEQINQALEVTTAKSHGHGDYQCNSALKLAKILGKSPRQIAETLVKATDPMIEKLEVAGPGFINITLQACFIESKLNDLGLDPRSGIKNTAHPKKVIVEFSSPNTAKELHVGHLRSTIIGDCIARLFEFLGHDVLRLNHIGDWGTPFGMLIHFLKTHHPKVLSGQEKTDLSHLAKWYKESRALFDSDEKFKKASQAQVVALQAREQDAIHAWETICEISRQGYQQIYDLLNVEIQERGESFYHDKLPAIIELFEKQNLVEISDGAKCVFLDDFFTKEGSKLPLIIQKSDGGYNYTTTDLSALHQRLTEEKANRIIYVVDNGQSLHFQMVFAGAKKAGYYDPVKTQVNHVPFGLVLGSDGKKFKTRSGDSEKLIDLLTQAVDKAKTILETRSENIQDVASTATVLGINAVKYADLSSLRTKDYMFSYDKMLQFEGNTASFLMYSYVRIQSMLAKSKSTPDSIAEVNLNLEHSSERELALALLQIREVLESMAESLLPNRLCDYLYSLAEKFNAFFRDCPVIGSNQETSRLKLCLLTQNVFKVGFSILGLQTVERM